MKNSRSMILLVLVGLIAFGASEAIAINSKVQVCHIPPGNPADFHTITVSEKALPAHLGHGDLPGDCFANCGSLCDDGDACTIDACDEETVTCLQDHPPVDCNDSNLCTVDTCDSGSGCQSAPIACNDGNACTVDTCNPIDGQCVGTPIDCGLLGVCLPETGMCDFPCDGITCDPIDLCHEAGECVLPGECVDGAAVANGTTCDDGNAGTANDVCTDGVCAGEPVPTAECPCWVEEDLLDITQCDTTLKCPVEEYGIFIAKFDCFHIPTLRFRVLHFADPNVVVCEQNSPSGGQIVISGLNPDEIQACEDSWLARVQSIGLCLP